MRRALVALALLLSVHPALRAQEPSAGVYTLAQVETQPRPANVAEFVAALNAAYPADKQAAVPGATVQVANVVGADGVPRDASVTTSTDAAFDSVTLASVAALRFTPATLSGRPVPVRIEFPVRWAPAAPEPDAPTSFTGTDGRAPAPTYLPDGRRVWELSDVDVTPRARNLPGLRRALEAYYPPSLRDAHVNGLVQVRFRVDAAGMPHDFIITSSNNAGFHEATVRALAELRFTPARKDGRPVDVWVELPISWTTSR